MTKARPRAEGDPALPYCPGPDTNPAIPHQPTAWPRARLPPKEDRGGHDQAKKRFNDHHSPK